MAQYTSQALPDTPSVTGALACESIPTKLNDYTGGNWTHWCNSRAAELMDQSDGELDPERRLELMQQIYAVEAQDFVSLPLYVLPEMAAWRTDRVAGPIGEFAGSEYGLFFNMNEWWKVQS